MRKVRYHAYARQEVHDAVRFYGSRGSVLAQTFLAKVEETVSLIVAYPGSGTELPQGIRSICCKVFPYSIMYFCDETTLWILAVAHQKRRPFYWSDRVAAAVTYPVKAERHHSGKHLAEPKAAYARKKKVKG